MNFKGGVGFVLQTYISHKTLVHILSKSKTILDVWIHTPKYLNTNEEFISWHTESLINKY